MVVAVLLVISVRKLTEPTITRTAKNGGNSAKDPKNLLCSLKCLLL